MPLTCFGSSFPRQAVALGVLLLGVFACVPAWAQTCGFSMGDLDFGFVTPLSPRPHDTSQRAVVDCSDTRPPPGGADLRVCFHIGAGSGGTGGGARQLQKSGTTARLPYNLYKNSARTDVWGAGDASPGAHSALTVMSRFPGGTYVGGVIFDVYARVPARVAVTEPGKYSSSFAGGQALISYGYEPFACDFGGSGGAVSFQVDALVPPYCEVEADDLDFGNAAALTRNIDINSQLRVLCSRGTAYEITLDAGTAPGATVDTRRMTRTTVPQRTISYQLYRDRARTRVWGMTTGQSQSGRGNGRPRPHTVYGRVPVQPAPISGIYHDTIVVTVTY
jgi:spore coat protein U-like protein